MKRIRSVSACLGALLLAGQAHGGVIYLANGDSQALQAVDLNTGNILYTATQHSIGYPIAVRDTIWIGERDNIGEAREYKKSDGSFTGNSASLTGPDPGQLLDGAASAITNFTVEFQSRRVFSANADWTGLAEIFTISSSDADGQLVDGIAFDPSLTRLWFQTQSLILGYDLAGNLLTSFSHRAGRGGLAYEAETDSLWLVPNNPTADLLNYSKTGTFLGSVTTPTRSFNIWGAEMAVSSVPEPGTLALLGLGLAGLAATRRRKQ